MTTLTHVDPPCSRGAGLTWSMTLTDEPDALMRVLSLLRRRRCEPVGVSYDLGDRHRATQLLVTVRSTGGRPDALEPWLRGLVDVLELERRR